MSIKVYNPTTNARRGMSVTDYSELSKVAPEKSLLRPLKKNSGRNNYGRITVRHHGGGNRRKYRVIDFKRTKFDVEATVKTLEYDPNRSAHIALIEYVDGVKSYILAPVGLKVGDKVEAGPNADIKPGNALPLQISQLVHSSTTLSFIQVKAVSLQELQVMLLSLWLKKAFTLFFVFHQVNLEMFL